MALGAATPFGCYGESKVVVRIRSFSTISPLEARHDIIEYPTIFKIVADQLSQGILSLAA